MIPIKQRNGLSIDDLLARAAKVGREKLDLSGGGFRYRCSIALRIIPMPIFFVRYPIKIEF